MYLLLYLQYVPCIQKKWNIGHKVRWTVSRNKAFHCWLQLHERKFHTCWCAAACSACHSLKLMELPCAPSGNEENWLTQVDVHISVGGWWLLLSLLLFACFRTCGPLCSMKIYILFLGAGRCTVNWHVLPTSRSTPEAHFLSFDVIFFLHSWPFSEPHSSVSIRFT